jgi:hypothetical protein
MPIVYIQQPTIEPLLVAGAMPLPFNHRVLNHCVSWLAVRMPLVLITGPRWQLYVVHEQGHIDVGKV